MTCTRFDAILPWETYERSYVSDIVETCELGHFFVSHGANMIEKGPFKTKVYQSNVLVEKALKGQVESWL